MAYPFLKKLVLCIGLSLLTKTGEAQAITIPTSFPHAGGYFGPTRTIVKLDPFSRIPIGEIPFDRYFYVRLYLDPSQTAPNAIWLLGPMEKNRGISNVLLSFTSVMPITSSSDDPFLKLYKGFDILIPPLDPNRSYALLFETGADESLIKKYVSIFYFMFQHKNTEARQLNNDPEILANVGRPTYADLEMYYYQHHLDQTFSQHRQDPQAGMQAVLSIINSDHFIVISSTQTKELFGFFTIPASFNSTQYKIETSAPLSLVADGGLVQAGWQKGFNILTPYAGLSYSLRPMDTDIPFRYIKKRIKFYQRLSINAGLTLTSFAKDKFRANTFGTNNLMLGLGYRFSHVVSITGGVVGYKQLAANPVLDKQSFQVAPYAGLSFNLKIKTAFNELSKIFSYGK